MEAISSNSKSLRIKELRQEQVRSPFLRASLFAAVVVLLWSWTAKSIHESVLTKEQRGVNLERFLGKITPDPIRESGEWADVLPWTANLLTEGNGIKAAGITFALATIAATLSGLLALLFLPVASRNLATQKPLGINNGNRPFGALCWHIINNLTRLLFVFTRSLPEYVLGFLLISILGPDPWALVLALAIHNFGILGRLGSELVENVPVEPARIIFAQGGGRFSSYISAIFPESFNRMTVYFFYRWETCVRESTVLGMLGVVSLGYLITDAKAGRDFDRMVAFVLLGALIVMAGDMISTLIRRRLRFERIS